MRNHDSDVQAGPLLEAPRGRENASSSAAGAAVEPQFALGTLAGMRVATPGPARARADLDLTAIPRPSVVFDAQGRILDVNPLAATLVGYACLELVGDPVERIAPVLAGAEQFGQIRFLSATSGACIRHRSGREVPVDMLLCPRDEWSTAAVLCAVESTEPGLREEEVAQIVHDLRGPLSTIALEVELLDDKLAPDERRDTRPAFARITRNVEFLDRMVQDLLDLCALDVARLELHRRPTDLRRLLERTIERVVPSRDRGRVALHAGAPLTMTIDDLRIERVVANLLHNALKYTPPVTGIVVGLAARSDAVRVSVTDAGPGMTPADAGRVFDKFRRGSTVGARDGSGLGLYVSRRIVEAHGGRIDVASVPGAGSQFFFELPAA